MNRTGKIATALGAAIAGGACWFYARELSTERARYTQAERDGAFSIRRYPTMIVAETMQAGSRSRALNSGFGILADYIFAESRDGEAIAMTAPVLAEQTGTAWRVRFVMPAKLARDALPQPGPGVTLSELRARTVAAVRFGGRATDELMAGKEAELRHWIAARGLNASGTAEHAYYNSPFVPGPMRRNEVLLAVQD
jgi:hypothetical protein